MAYVPSNITAIANTDGLHIARILADVTLTAEERMAQVLGVTMAYQATLVSSGFGYMLTPQRPLVA